MKRTLFTIGYAAVLALASATAVGQTNNIVPQPMPDGFNHPTPGYVIEQWVENNNVAQIRGHGWDIWNAMAQPSGQMYSGDGKTMVELPVWETWQTDNELFNTPTSVAEKKTRTLHPFHLAHQQTHLNPNAQAGGDVVVSFNKFDPTAAAFILAEQAAPDGSGVNLPINNQAGLTAYNKAWPKETSVGARATLGFPETAIETKPVFFPVLAKTLTAVPFWQGLAGAQPTAAKNPTPNTWLNCVLVDATNAATSGLRAATTKEVSGAKVPTGFACQTYYYAPIGMYYGVMLDANGAKGFNNLQGDQGLSLSQGDYAVLTAMHVNTKEMDRWTWQTYYWQGNAQVEVTFPGSLSDAPADLAAPWNSYAMCTAYDQVVGGKQVVCFNPYLETSPGIPDGINSNCVTCHGMARVGPSVSGATRYPPTYTNPLIFQIPLQFDNPIWFGGTTKTDFSWAVAGSP